MGNINLKNVRINLYSKPFKIYNVDMNEKIIFYYFYFIIIY